MPKKTSKPKAASTQNKLKQNDETAVKPVKQHFLVKEGKRYEAKGFGLAFAIL